MTSYRRITSRTLNRSVQQQDNMVTFMTPLSRAIYPNYFSVPDASTNALLVSTGSPYSATASSQLTFNGTTLTDFGNLDVSGNTAVQSLKAYKNIDVSGNLNVQLNALVYGTITANQFLPGQVINMVMLGYTQTDLSQNTLVINPAATTSLFSFSYTPKNTQSYLLVEYQSGYSLGGSGDDQAQAYLYANDGTDNRIGSTLQSWVNSLGGGTRSGALFPIIGRYTNTTLAAKTIRVDVFNNTIGDPITVRGDNSTWLKITEIGR